MSGPNSKPGVGQQTYRTPSRFLLGCLNRFGLQRFDFDLACTELDCVAPSGFYHPRFDAIAEDWSPLASKGLVAWCNPPFAKAKDFAAKAAETTGLRAVFLVPVAIGTRWWRESVHKKAVVTGVGRLVFDLPDGTPVLGKNGKPQGINRDCVVLAYNILPPGTDWYLLEDWARWRQLALPFAASVGKRAIGRALS